MLLFGGPGLGLSRVDSPTSSQQLPNSPQQFHNPPLMIACQPRHFVGQLQSSLLAAVDWPDNSFQALGTCASLPESDWEKKYWIKASSLRVRVLTQAMELVLQAG